MIASDLSAAYAEFILQGFRAALPLAAAPENDSSEGGPRN